MYKWQLDMVTYLNSNSGIMKPHCHLFYLEKRKQAHVLINADTQKLNPDFKECRNVK